MIALRCLPFTIALLVCCSALPQQQHLRKGHRACAEARPREAIVHFENAARQGAPDSSFADRLAMCYRDLGQTEQAEHWFARAVAHRTVAPRILLMHANTLRANGHYEEADRVIARYTSLAPTAQRARWTGVDATTIRLLNDSARKRCLVKGLPLNSTEADLSPALRGNKLVFASARSSGRASTWDGAGYLDLYEADVLHGDALGEPRPLVALNTRYHESHATFSPDGQEVWFDRNNFHDKRKGRNAAGVMEMRIFGRKRVGGAWSAEVPFAFNGEQGSSCHPSLSPSGQLLFFASDRPGGHGGSDIWYCARDAQGNWQAPVCLGPEVNSEGDEGFPFLSAKGDLYFASDGHPGLGGLDILRCPFDGRNVTGRAVNPGAPLNSPADDFGLTMGNDGLLGYFVSNRSGGAGSDDLYRAVFREPVVGASGVVRDRLSAVLLPGTRVLLTDKEGNPLDSTVVDNMGHYRMAMERGRTLQLVFAHPGYRTLSYPVETPAGADSLFTISPPMAFLRNVGLWMFVTDSHTGEGIRGAEVVVIDVANGNTTLVQDRTDPSGDHRSLITDVSIHDSLVYRVKLNREGYFPKKGLFLYVVPDSGEIAMHHEMDISMDPIVVGADAGKLLDLAPIRFATGRWEILPDAALELDKVVGLLQENPNLSIELRGHTDSRGTAASNRALSAKRSQSAAEYIIGSGIFADRVRSRGYGESALLNPCSDGVKCSEEEHAANRRTEFIVVGK